MSMINLFNIGFTQKSAAVFFNILKSNNINCLVDIRLNPNGQLSRFAFKNDLPFFLDNLCNHCKYSHRPDLAPAKELLFQVRDKSDPMSKDYTLFEAVFIKQLKEHSKIIDFADEFGDYENVALLCSEPSNAKCHRRLVSDMLVQLFPEKIRFGANL